MLDPAFEVDKFDLTMSLLGELFAVLTYLCLFSWNLAEGGTIEVVIVEEGYPKVFSGLRLARSFD